jgi:hypothetical protein
MAEIVDHLLFLELAVVEPMFAIALRRRLERRLAQGDKEARLAAYTWTIVSGWAFVVAVLTWWIVAGRSATSLGLAAPGGIPVRRHDDRLRAAFAAAPETGSGGRVDDQ